MDTQSAFESDRRLVESILAGDRQAWEKLVRRVEGFVWAILRRGFRLPEDRAADVFQEVFLKLQEDNFRRLRRWRGQARLETYLAVVARRLVVDLLRAHRRKPDAGWQGPRPDIDPPDPGPDAEQEVLLEEKRRAVRNCLERLPDRDQQLLALRYDLELSYRKIATRMSLTVTNVGVALTRAEARLKQCLQERYLSLLSDWEPVAPAPA